MSIAWTACWGLHVVYALPGGRVVTSTVHTNVPGVDTQPTMVVPTSMLRRWRADVATAYGVPIADVVITNWLPVQVDEDPADAERKAAEVRS